MSDEIHDDTELDDAEIEDAEIDDDDEDAEVEGHVMFAEKKGFGLKQDIQIPAIYRPGADGGDVMGPANTNEPVLSDDVDDDDEDAEVEGHVMFAEKKGFSLKPDLFAPPCAPELDDWERTESGLNTNEPVLEDDDDAEVAGYAFAGPDGMRPELVLPKLHDFHSVRLDALTLNTNESVLDDGF